MLPPRRPKHWPLADTLFDRSLLHQVEDRRRRRRDQCGEIRHLLNTCNVFDPTGMTRDEIKSALFRNGPDEHTPIDPLNP